MDLYELKARLRQFAEERDWDQFHSPKNLAMALSVEVAEEIADVQFSLVRLVVEEEGWPPGGPSQ